ncbi:MAG: carbohydrate binding domain-containing protein [Pseudomonadota bacterium]
MTVSSAINRIQHAGNGASTTFAYNFKIFDENDLTVILTDSSGAETTKTVNTDYTVSGVGLDAGGNVVCTSFIPATGETLTILRELDLVQETDLMPNDPLPAETLEEVFDRALMISQQLNEALSRSLQLKKSSSFSDLGLPDPDANKLLSWNAAGDDLENRAAADVSLTTVTTYIQTLLDDPDAAAARATLDVPAIGIFSAEHSAAGVHDSVRLVNLIPNAGLCVWSLSGLGQGTTGRQAGYEIGSDLVSNGGFTSSTTGWTPTNCTLASVAGGQSGNCLEITRTGGSSQYAAQTVTTVAGKLYKLTAWVKSGTSGNEALAIKTTDGSNDLAITNGTSSGAWVEYSCIFKATTATTYILLLKVSATAGTMLFDTVSVYEVQPGCVGADDYGPDWWTKTTTLDLIRVQNDTTHCVGLYGVKAIKGAAGSEYFNAFGRVFNLEHHYSLFRGRTVTFGCWVYSVSAADNVKLQINDSGGTTQSSFVAADSLTWVEVTRTCGASITSFTPRLLFDGDALDAVYVSQPMLVLGPSIGEGNYCPPVQEIIKLEQIVRSISNATISANTNYYLEAATNGAIPKNTKAIRGALQGSCGTANKTLYFNNGGYYDLALVSWVASLTGVAAGWIVVPVGGVISLARNDTFSGVYLDIGEARVGR